MRGLSASGTSIRITIGLIALVFIFGCGGSDAPSDPAPQSPVFSSLVVSLSPPDLFSLPPDNTAVVTASPRDQNGSPMTGLGQATFSSDNESVATVSPSGLVTATGAGVTQIRASLTAGGLTRTAAATVNVHVAPSSAAVQAPQLAFAPLLVHVSAGGTVTWTIGPIPHNVTFASAAGVPADIPTMALGSSESRTFLVSGSFPYQCTVHPGMSGTVHVH